MNMNQEEMNMIAQKAKAELEKQKKKTNDNQQFDYSNIMNGTENDSDILQSQEKINYNDSIPKGVTDPAPTMDVFDEELFPGGPTKSQIGLWRKEWDGYDIYIIEILEKYTFVFRTLSRYEYKQLVSYIDINALQKEETICNSTILWPENYDCSTMAAQKAGIPSTLSSIIMEKSGFTKDYVIQEL